jgi:hypothetical protein
MPENLPWQAARAGMEIFRNPSGIFYAPGQLPA